MLRIERFSPKQKTLMTWWTPESPHRGRDAVICDGAVRSGKTVCMGLSFFLWAFSSFPSGGQFGLCGRTMGSLRRNLLDELAPYLRRQGFRISEKKSENTLTARLGGKEHRFYIFGGGNEASAALIQGVTLCGALLDEAALMPRSFVEQAVARCSVSGSKIWMNCNPQHPGHWFYSEWVLAAGAKNALYLHFTMDDNPSLSPAVRRRYERMYSGSFYRRFVLGQWTALLGRVYDFFDPERDAPPPPPEETIEEYAVSCDYGTRNPSSFGLWGRRGGVWHRISEYYYDSRERGECLTDARYVRELQNLVGGRRLSAVVADPSAASFIEALRREGFYVMPARNDVLSGIRKTAALLAGGKIVICDTCRDCLREIALYRWKEGAADEPVKENDHAMDDMRYFAATWAARDAGAGIAAVAVRRRG